MAPEARVQVAAVGLARVEAARAMAVTVAVERVRAVKAQAVAAVMAPVTAAADVGSIHPRGRHCHQQSRHLKAIHQVVVVLHVHVLCQQYLRWPHADHN